jgi:uncharacterized phage infection (PIP) family protein YhgE
MSTNELDRPKEPTQTPNGHGAVIAGLVVVLLIALGGDAYLLNRSNSLNDQIAQIRTDTQAQMSKLSDATSTLLEQRMQSLDGDLKDAHNSVDTAFRRARSEAQKQSAKLSEELEQQQKQVGDELTQLKDATTTASSKISEVSGDVDNVKTDVTAVKSDVASTQSELEKHASDLKRMTGDMGVMSGLIATNGKDLQTLRALGERNYYEFDLRKGQLTKKVGDITLTLKKSDPKHNRYTMAIQADDKTLQKKDRTINEPVQLYVGGNRQPCEVVVNQVKKDEVIGYVSTPKMQLTRQASTD